MKGYRIRQAICASMAIGLLLYLILLIIVIQLANHGLLI